MLRSIVERAVNAQADLQLADEDCDGLDLEDAVTRCGADVLVVEERPEQGEAFYRPLLLSHPSLKVFILTRGGRDVTFLGLRRVRLVDASPTTLIDAIRAELGQQARSDAD